jgi:hypothetical protein
MQIIKTVAALEAVSDPTLRPHLERYADMMDLAVVFIVEPTDTLASVEHARGWPFEDFEFLHLHGTSWFEAVFVLDQYGSGHVVFVPDRPDTDPTLLQLCRANSEPAPLPYG